MFPYSPNPREIPDDGGTEGEVLEMEGGIQEQGAESEPREDKGGSEWGRR